MATGTAQHRCPAAVSSCQHSSTTSSCPLSRRESCWTSNAPISKFLLSKQCVFVWQKSPYQHCQLCLNYSHRERAHRKIITPAHVYTARFWRSVRRVTTTEIAALWDAGRLQRSAVTFRAHHVLSVKPPHLCEHTCDMCEHGHIHTTALAPTPALRTDCSSVCSSP